LESSTSDEHNTNFGTSPTRLFKDTPNPDGNIDGFLKPTTPKRKGAKSSKNPITVVDTSGAAKLKLMADLAENHTGRISLKTILKIQQDPIDCTGSGYIS